MAALLFNDGFCIGDNLLRSSIMSRILPLKKKSVADVTDWNIRNLKQLFFFKQKEEVKYL